MESSLYLFITKMIENEILKKNLMPGDQVPSKIELSKFYNVNPITALKGVNILVELGALYQKRGIGTFVSEDAYNLIHDKRTSELFNVVLKNVLDECDILEYDRELLITKLGEK